MDEIYRILKQKIKEMHDNRTDSVSINYEDVARLYQMVCYMKQIKEIANGWD
jgi:predicted component of viral defense system (DUF524 family)